jgi:hypothetical protein
MALTQQAIDRLRAATPEVRLINGVFNVVRVVAKFDRYSYELSVKVTHALLAAYAGAKPNETSLMRWEGSSGHCVDLPDELRELVGKLRHIGRMSDHLAITTRNGVRNALVDRCQQLGMSADLFA